jgi:hypothetical protein
LATFGTLPAARRGRAREENYKTMWATALTICALVALLVALAYAARTARRLEATLDVLMQKQYDEKARLQRDLDRVRSVVIPA